MLFRSKSTFATLSRSPTKIPEYLACGVPVIANTGVGDVDTLINSHEVGSLVTELSRDGFRSALERVEGMRASGGLESRCRMAAESEFELAAVGWTRYLRIYDRMMATTK